MQARSVGLTAASLARLLTLNPAASPLTAGAGGTPITGGTASGILWNNAGVLASGAATLAGGVNLAGVTTASIGGATLAAETMGVLGLLQVAGAASGNATGSFRLKGGYSNSSGLFFTQNSATDTATILQAAGGGTLALGGNNVAQLTLTANLVTVTSGAALKLGNAYVGTPAVGTGTVTIQDSGGNTLRVLVANP